MLGLRFFRFIHVISYYMMFGLPCGSYFQGCVGIVRTIAVKTQRIACSATHVVRNDRYY